MPDEPFVRFGVLGTGRITRRLIPDLQSSDGVSVSAIASRDPTRARWHADQHGIAAGVSGYDQLWCRDDVDAVYIALPPAEHAGAMIEAAKHGKHVLCEKPLAVSSGELAEITAACDRAGIAWLDATAWLHHDRTDAFLNWIAKREEPIDRDRMPASVDAANLWRLGTLRHISASVSFCNPFQSDDHRLHARHGGGCLLDLGWYAAGAVALATQAEPKSVYADAVMVGDVPHRVTAVVRMTSGVSATISCGFDTATRKWFEIAGAEASIVCDDFTRPWPDKPARCWIHEASGKVHAASFEGHQERQMVETLLLAITNNDSASLSHFQHQAARTQSLLDAIAESIQTQQPVHFS
ncbi:MAG: Gfo/Idh/MocA family oxidoreductase [Planctomycetota bacterium]